MTKDNTNNTIKLLSPMAGQGEREKRNAPETTVIQHAERGAFENRQPIRDSSRRLGPPESPYTKYSVSAKNHRLFPSARHVAAISRFFLAAQSVNKPLGQFIPDSGARSRILELNLLRLLLCLHVPIMLIDPLVSRNNDFVQPI